MDGIYFNLKQGDAVEINGEKIIMRGVEQNVDGGKLTHRATMELTQIANTMIASDGGKILNEVSSGKLVQTGNQIRATSTGEILTKLDQVDSAMIDSNNIEGNMPAIKATNSRNLTVRNSRFFGFDTAIELDNVDGFVSDNNRFAEKFDPQVALSELSKSIQNSALDNSSKERLAREVIHFLTSQSKDETQKTELTNRLKFLGGKAAEHFMRLVTDVAAGLIVRAVT